MLYFIVKLMKDCSVTAEKADLLYDKVRYLTDSVALRTLFWFTYQNVVT